MPDPALNRLHLNLTVVPGLARVQSDALPLTLHADKLVVPDPEEGEDGKESDNLVDLPDFNSMAVEIGSSGLTKTKFINKGHGISFSSFYSHNLPHSSQVDYLDEHFGYVH